MTTSMSDKWADAATHHGHQRIDADFIFPRCGGRR